MRNKPSEIAENGA